MTTWSQCLALYDGLPGTQSDVENLHEFDFSCFVETPEGLHDDEAKEQIRKVNNILRMTIHLQVTIGRCLLAKNLILLYETGLFENVKVDKLVVNKTKKLEPKGWSYLGRLSQQAGAKELHAHQCNLSTASMKEFIRGIGNAVIDILHVGGMAEMDKDYWLHLGSLVFIAKIKKLSVVGCKLTAEHLASFIQGKKHANITELNISGNILGAEEWFQVGKLVDEARIMKLTTMLLNEENRILTANCLDKLMEGMGQAKITELDISGNEMIEEDGWLKLGVLVKEFGLLKLSACSCEPNQECLQKFIQGIGEAKLNCLDLSCSHRTTLSSGQKYKPHFQSLLKLLPAIQDQLVLQCMYKKDELGRLYTAVERNYLQSTTIVIYDSYGHYIKRLPMKLAPTLPKVKKVKVEEIDGRVFLKWAAIATESTSAAIPTESTSYYIEVEVDGKSVIERPVITTKTTCEFSQLKSKQLHRFFIWGYTKQSISQTVAGISHTMEIGEQAEELDFKHQSDNPNSNEETAMNKPHPEVPSTSFTPEDMKRIEQQTEASLSTPITKVRQIGPEGGGVSLNGCDVHLPEQKTEIPTTVAFSVTMNSKDAPAGYTGISPEIRCQTSQTNGKFTITVPITTLPEDSNQIRIACKKNKNSDWEVLEFEPEVNKRSAKFSATCAGIFKAVMKRFQRWKANVYHQVLFNPKTFYFCDLTCTDDETVIKKCIENLKNMEFHPVSCIVPETMILGKSEDVICEYSYHITTTKVSAPFHRVNVKGSAFTGAHYFYDFFKLSVTRELANICFQYTLRLGQSKDRVGPLFSLVPAVDSNPEPFESEPASGTPPSTPVYRVSNPVKEIEITPSSQEFYEKHRNNKEVYPLRQNSHKGKVLIINNNFRWQKKERDGSDVDVGNLTALWQNFGFEVQIENNLTANMMRQHFTDFATDASNVSIVVLIIMTHGGKRDSEEYFLGEDGLKISSEEVIHAFSTRKSPHLQGIPKVFIFQACRGDETDSGLEKSNVDVDSGERKYPERSDMLIVYPSQSGFVSFRNRESGSWMMNAVTDTFMRHAHNTDVLHMLTKVNGKVAEMQTVEGQVQMSNQLSYLRKLLYLFPGWPKSSCCPSLYGNGCNEIHTHV